MHLVSIVHKYAKGLCPSLESHHSVNYNLFTMSCSISLTLPVAFVTITCDIP